MMRKNRLATNVVFGCHWNHHSYSRLPLHSLTKNREHKSRMEMNMNCSRENGHDRQGKPPHR